MAQNKSQMRKTMGWASFALGAFTAISVIVPIIWDRMARREQGLQDHLSERQNLHRSRPH